MITSLLKQCPELPVYLLENDDPYYDVTVQSYADDGVRGVVKGPGKNNKQFDGSMIRKTVNELFMISAAEKLARTQKVLSYKTRIKFKENKQESGGLTAYVDLINLALEKAPKAEDISNLVADSERPDIMFKDVIGCERAKKQLGFIIEYLRLPRKFSLKGYPVPTGVLLYGDPGTGKTMLAKACAGESDVSFIASQDSLMLSEGTAYVRKIFEIARRNAPSILFIDEIDSVGKQRRGNDSYTEAVLNTILAEMDGFATDQQTPVIVIAATNADLSEGEGIATIDSALARRFSHTIKMELPNAEERTELIKLYLKSTVSGFALTDEELSNVAELTEGMSPSIIRKCMRSALQTFIDKGSEEKGSKRNLDILTEEINQELYGNENKDISEEEKKMTACHEIGHVLCYRNAIGHYPLLATSVSRSNFGGFTRLSSAYIPLTPSERDYLNQILVCLGGKAAEELHFKDRPDLVTSGPLDDLRRASGIAYNIGCLQRTHDSQIDHHLPVFSY